MNRPTRYLAIGFALGVVATRRLGRRRRRVSRRLSWQRTALDVVTLGFALKEIADELETYGRREIGSPAARRSVDAGDGRPALTAGTP